MKHFPQQRIPFSKKSANDFEWAKNVMDTLLIDEAPDSEVIQSHGSDYYRKLSNYQLYNNQINQVDFDRECNRFGVEVGQFKDTIAPYNKTYNKIQALLGDELNRPFRFRPVLINSDGIRSKLAHRDAMLRKFVYSKMQDTINSVSNMYSADLMEEESEKIMDPLEIDRYMSTKYLEAREITASKILNYFMRKQAIRDKKNDSYKHALISGDEVVWVGEVNGEPIVDVVNPLGFFHHKSAEVKYIEDSLYAGYRTYMTSGDVLDKFGLYLSDDDIKSIDATFQGGRLIGAHLPGPTMDYHLDDVDRMLYSGSNSVEEGSYSQSNMEDWLVQHLEWVSQKEVGFLTFTNMYGDEEEDIVDHTFEVPDYATKSVVVKEYGRKCTYYHWSDSMGNSYTFEWGWIPEVWSGIRLGHNIYTMIGPKKHQFRSLDNPYHVKLGYHGVIYNAMNAASTSLMDRMKPFQYLYFIIMHKLKKLVAHDRGKTFHFDTSMVDGKIGWEKTVYYLEEMDIDFFNPLQNAEKPGAYQRTKIGGSTDRSNMQHILNYVQLLASIDEQISDVAGVSRGREGQVSPGEAVTNAQANIQMSALVTEVYFHNHDRLWENVLTSLVQVAQSCWKHKSIVKQFALDDLSLATLELTPESLLNSDFAVFITNSSKDQEVFDNLKALSQALIQNDKAKFSDIVKTLRTDSIEELESHIIQSEAKALAEQQQQIQAQLQAEAQMQQAQQQFELEKQALDHENKIIVEQIRALSFSEDKDADDDGMPDIFEVEKFKAELNLKNRKLDLEEKKIKQDAEQREKDRKVKSKTAAKK